MFSFPVMKRSTDPAPARLQPGNKYLFGGAKRLSASPVVQTAKTALESQDTFRYSPLHPSQSRAVNSTSSSSFKRAVHFGNQTPAQQVEQILKDIPPTDVQKLSRYFRILMTSSQTPIGYTFFGDVGDKPMSFVESDEIRHEKLMPLHRIWKKYETKLPKDNLSIRLQRWRRGTPDIFVINKKAFLKTVSNNLDKFQAVLGADMTPQSLLDDILSDESLVLRDKLDNSEELYGLLFGLTEGDTDHADLPLKEGNRHAEQFIHMSDFGDTDTYNHTKVILPQCLSINRRNPSSFALVRHWQAQQPYLQAIVNIPDDREFLRVMLYKWADASLYPALPLGRLGHS